jgi:hypothetical protein
MSRDNNKGTPVQCLPKITTFPIHASGDTSREPAAYISGKTNLKVRSYLPCCNCKYLRRCLFNDAIGNPRVESLHLRSDDRKSETAWEALVMQRHFAGGRDEVVKLSSSQTFRPILEQEISQIHSPYEDEESDGMPVKFTPEQTTQAQRGIRDITLLFL